MNINFYRTVNSVTDIKSTFGFEDMSGGNSTIYLNDSTVFLINEASQLPNSCLKVGPLHTPIQIERGSFHNVSQLEILPGTESYNIGRILVSCTRLKSFNLGNLEKEGVTRIFGGQSSFKSLIWRHLTTLELCCTNSTSLFQNTIEIIKYKRFPCLHHLIFTCRVPFRSKMNSYIETYVDIHHLIVTNRRSLRKVNIFHDLDFDITSATNGYYNAESKQSPYLEFKNKIFAKLRKDLASLKLHEFTIRFSPLESPLEWIKPRVDLDIEILKSLSTVTSADLDWGNASFWTDKEKDFANFAKNNSRTLKKLRIRMVFGQNGFDCSLLTDCPHLDSLAIDSVWCKLKNIHFTPTSLKHLELRLPLKPAQKTWISNNLVEVETLMVEQTLQDEQPVLSFLRLPKLKTLTVIYCSKNKTKELNLFCFNHPGVVMYERDDIPSKYFNIGSEYIDITITIDRSKYTHDIRFEDEETKSEIVD